MALPLALAGAQAGLSIASSIAGNAAISKAAASQYSANKLFIERDQSVLNNQLQLAGQEINNQVGMALSGLIFQARSAQAADQAQRIEREVYGNTAVRAQAVAEMKASLTAANLKQQGEASMADIQNKLSEAKYQIEARHAQNSQAYNNAMSEQSSMFETVVGGVQGAVSGYSLGQNISLANTRLATATGQAAKATSASASLNASRNVAQNSGQLGVRPIGY